MRKNDQLDKPVDFKETEGQRKKREAREQVELEQQRLREEMLKLMMDPNNNDF